MFWQSTSLNCCRTLVAALLTSSSVLCHEADLPAVNCIESVIGSGEVALFGRLETVAVMETNSRMGCSELQISSGSCPCGSALTWIVYKSISSCSNHLFSVAQGVLTASTVHIARGTNIAVVQHGASVHGNLHRQTYLLYKKQRNTRILCHLCAVQMTWQHLLQGAESHKIV